MSQATIFLVMVALSAITTSSSATEVSRCGNSFPEVDASKVSISGCDAGPCTLQRDAQVTVEQSFTLLEEADFLQTIARITVSGFQISLNGPDGSDVCESVYNADGTQASCPLTVGNDYVYKRTFVVPNSLATGSSNLRWGVSDGENDITCFKVAAVIV